MRNGLAEKSINAWTLNRFLTWVQHSALSDFSPLAREYPKTVVQKEDQQRRTVVISAVGWRDESIRRSQCNTAEEIPLETPV
jgi:hypothetical protein